MLTLAVLPMKSFDGAKQRLHDQYTPSERRALAEAMFSDVLVALRRSASIEEMLVVSGDRRAQQIAAGYGAMVRSDGDLGHNPAAIAGVQEALERGADRALLVPADCPLLNPAQVDELLAERAPGRSALIVPDRHGTGTNALLLTPPDALVPSFGPGSCQRHAALAESAGIAHRVIEVSSLALDIDTPDDLEALQAKLASTHGGAAHTRGMLNQLMRSRT